MALTPEDVVNKRFQPTKFREGYDQDEVDDFLDEVVVELRRLNQENDELRQRLARHESGASGDGHTSIRPATAGDAAATGTPAATSGAAAPATGESGTETAASPAVSGTDATGDAGTADPTSSDAAHATDTDSTDAHSTDSQGADARTDQSRTDAVDETTTTGTPTPGVDAAADTAVPATSGTPATAAAGLTSAQGTTPAADNAAGLLAMAQRIHDEYVNSGIEQRDSIIAEAQSKAESMVSDAEAHRTKTLTDLEHQKSDLERQVEQLRGFERDYRSRLKEYIESQLHDLQTTGSVEHRSDNA
ncbi:DivIVA domain-containing protein [Tersicoccus sp. MR15.9]|uniref:DivIVA domain-containing protein n=1 Tax=Tersicoccus mangrovi TaxID=3121635 RepID=UPI002FE674FE